jgi:hypothetical protein
MIKCAYRVADSRIRSGRLRQTDQHVTIAFVGETITEYHQIMDLV